MKNEFIPYEQALALKELGFDEQCFSFYDANGELYESEGYYRYSDNVHKDEVIAPLYQQALSDYKEGEIYVYKTYEETELACLKKLIKISTQSKSENEELTPHIKYHNNGNVWIKGQKNSKGQHEGIWEIFYEDGNIFSRTSYKEGKEDGIVEWFDEQRNIVKTYVWKKGKLIKETKH